MGDESVEELYCGRRGSERAKATRAARGETGKNRGDTEPGRATDRATRARGGGSEGNT